MWIMVLLILVMFASFFDRALAGILAENIKRDLNLTDGELGWALGVSNRKSTRLTSSHSCPSRMPPSARKKHYSYCAPSHRPDTQLPTIHSRPSHTSSSSLPPRTTSIQ